MRLRNQKRTSMVEAVPTIQPRATSGQASKNVIPMAVKQPLRVVYGNRANFGSVCGRSEMECYFERLLALERVDSVDAFGMKGIQRLCDDLSISPVSFEMYALIWKMGVTRGACIPRTDWLTLMYTYKIDQLVDLKCNITEWVKDAKGSAFPEFYNDLYDYIRGEEARLMLYETAVKAWGVLFSDDPRVKPWIEWYSQVYKRDVTRDVWQQFQVFLSNVPTLDSFSADGKWASVIEEFVEWRKSSL